MIKTVVIPENGFLNIPVPKDYNGKEVQVLLYTNDEVLVEKTVKEKNASRFKGLLTEEEAEKYDKYLQQARSEWDRNI